MIWFLLCTMPNDLANKIISSIEPYVGRVVAQAGLKTQCRKIGKNLETIDRAKLAMSETFAGYNVLSEYDIEVAGMAGRAVLSTYIDGNSAQVNSRAIYLPAVDNYYILLYTGPVNDFVKYDAAASEVLESFKTITLGEGAEGL